MHLFLFRRNHKVKPPSVLKISQLYLCLYYSADPGDSFHVCCTNISFQKASIYQRFLKPEPSDQSQWSMKQRCGGNGFSRMLLLFSFTLFCFYCSLLSTEVLSSTREEGFRFVFHFGPMIKVSVVVLSILLLEDKLCAGSKRTDAFERGRRLNA